MASTKLYCVLVYLDDFKLSTDMSQVNRWHFSGTSYIDYRTQFRRPIERLELTVSFKPEGPSGLLLFASRYNDGSGSFIALQIVDQYLQFAIDVGQGTTLTRYIFSVYIGY